MGLINTLGSFCYIECDESECTTKLESNDSDRLRRVAGVCGWTRSGELWRCPTCTETFGPRGIGADGIAVRTRKARA